MMCMLLIGCVGDGSQKNIVFLSKKVAGNSRVIDAISSGMMRRSTSKRGHLQNIVLLSKRRQENIVLLSKDYCVPG
jgi:hypothetical protein